MPDLELYYFSKQMSKLIINNSKEDRSMVEDISNLLLSYIDWMKEQYDIASIGTWKVITTPFLDRHNDHIQVYVSIDVNGKCTLTDDGDTLGDLEASGWNPSTEKRKKFLMQALHGVGIELMKENVIGTTTTPDEFPRKMHNLIQAILAVNDLYYTSRQNVESLFVEDVMQWMKKHDVRYTPNVSLIGQSGYSNIFHFVIPASKVAPERLIQTCDGLTLNAARLYVFQWVDVKTVRDPEAKMYVIVNNEQTVHGTPLSICESHGVNAISFPQLDSITDKMTA